jgi:hypothetical protein
VLTAVHVLQPPRLDLKLTPAALNIATIHALVIVPAVAVRVAAAEPTHGTVLAVTAAAAAAAAADAAGVAFAVGIAEVRQQVTQGQCLVEHKVCSREDSRTRQQTR